MYEQLVRERREVAWTALHEGHLLNHGWNSTKHFKKKVEDSSVTSLFSLFLQKSA